MKKPIDLSVGPVKPHAPLPNFRRQFRVVGSATTSTSAAIFNPVAACTVQWILVQTSAACTLQLQINNQPFGAALSLTSGSILRLAGTLLANNDSLSLKVSAATTLTYEVVWTKEIDLDLVVNDSDLLYAGVGIVTDNISQWGSIAVAPAISDAPVGTESAPVIRTIGRKKTLLLTSTPLAANGVFTSPWFDSELDGTAAIVIEAVSNVASAVGGFTVQGTNDTTVAAMYKVLNNFTLNPAVNILVADVLYRRYWRVIYTNAGVAQTSFEINVTCFTEFPSIVESNPTLSLIASNVQITGNTFVGADDNQTTYITANSAGWPLLTSLLKWGGGFSGTSDSIRQKYSTPRMPTVFRQVSTAATGSTAVWTPASGNKFRLLGYRVQVTGLAKAAVAADLKIALLDAAADISQSSYCTIQTTALTLDGNAYDSGWISLGEFGILSALANNVLNVNLSFALTGGLVNINTQGVEE